MLDRLIHVLVQSNNEAADDLLLEALRLGNEQEKAIALGGLIRRRTLRGLSGVIDCFETLPEPLRIAILRDIKAFHSALRECGRSKDSLRRMASMKMIACGHQGKLAFVLSENLHEADPALSKAAAEAMVALARWITMETRNLQKGNWAAGPATQLAGSPPPLGSDPPPISPATVYRQLMEERPEVEQAVARALDVHRGAHGPELLRAGLLLCDWPGSKTLAILNTIKHGGQSGLIRKLQQPPASEHVEAFLLGASHGGLRTHFGATFAQIVEPPAMESLLRKTHWLKDYQLQICMRQVIRGPWLSENDLQAEILRRSPMDAARIGHWIACTGAEESAQDQRLIQLYVNSRNDFDARLRLLRLAARRPRGTSVQLLKAFLTDPDERLARMAVREIVRRRPADYNNMLLQLMTGASPSIRRIIARAVGQQGFEQFWQRFGTLDKATRRQAGKAMLKILPDAPQRLARRLADGPIEQRLKAMQIVQELELAQPMLELLVRLCSDPNPRLRSKAIHVLGNAPEFAMDVLLDHVLNDSDARVRANAIEVLEAKRKTQYLPLLTQRAREANNRERANAIKAMHQMKLGNASTQLQNMLQDERPEHRISALWTMRQVGLWDLLREVGRMAREDDNLRVRRYALGILRTVSEAVLASQTPRTKSA